MMTNERTEQGDILWGYFCDTFPRGRAEKRYKIIEYMLFFFWFVVLLLLLLLLLPLAKRVEIFILPQPLNIHRQCTRSSRQPWPAAMSQPRQQKENVPVSGVSFRAHKRRCRRGSRRPIQSMLNPWQAAATCRNDQIQIALSRFTQHSPKLI